MRKLVRWGWLPVALAFCYAGWILYNRGAENRRIESQSEQKRARQDAQLLEKLGGSELKVVTFYANPPVVKQGAKGLLCYGVVNAKEVRIEPAVPDVGPALSRCVEVSPTKTTEYNLIAVDAKGTEARSTTTVTVP